MGAGGPLSASRRRRSASISTASLASDPGTVRLEFLVGHLAERLGRGRVGRAILLAPPIREPPLQEPRLGLPARVAPAERLQGPGLANALVLFYRGEEIGEPWFVPPVPQRVLADADDLASGRRVV